MNAIPESVFLNALVALKELEELNLKGTVFRQENKTIFYTLKYCQNIQIV